MPGVGKRSTGEILFDVANYAVLSLLLVVTLYPFLYVLFASVSLPSELVKHGSLLLSPVGFQLDSYRMVFRNPMISIGYLNTLFYVGAGTLLNVSLTMMAGYVLSRRWFSGRNFLMFFLVLTMFFAGGLIPSYLLVKGLGLTNTRLSLILPGAVSTWNVIITRTYFHTIPDSVEESARIDGANDFAILLRIMVPLAVPIIAVITLYYAVGHWNAWFHAMIYLRKRVLYPLQLILREILISSSTDSMIQDVTDDREPVSENIKYATIIVSTVPIVCVYPFLQRYFVKGIMIGAVKG